MISNCVFNKLPPKHPLIIPLFYDVDSMMGNFNPLKERLTDTDTAHLLF